MKVVRPLIGVAVGYAVMALFLHFFGPGPTGSGMGYFIESAAWTVAAALLAGFTTAWIALGAELPAASILGLVIVAMSVVAMRRRGISRPGWYETSMAGCGPVAALLGAAIRLLIRRRG